MQNLTLGLFSPQLIRSISMFVMGLFQSFISPPVARNRSRGRWFSVESSSEGGKGGNSKNGDSHIQRRVVDIDALFRTPPMMLSKLGDLLFKVGKAGGAKIPKALNSPKSNGFVRPVPVAVFSSIEISIKAYLEMFELSLRGEGWTVDYCRRVDKSKLEMVSASLHQVPVWFRLDLQHNLPAKVRKERVDLGRYLTHPLATLSAMMLNPRWLESLGTTVDGVKVGGADIVTVVLPGLTQMYCPTRTLQNMATLHCVAIQINPTMKRVHIGLRPVNTIPCGSMLIPLVVPS